MLSWEMQSHRAMSAQPGVAFFDRGVPDVIGYLRLLGSPIPPHMTKAAGLFRYHRKAYVCPPWPEIFQRACASDNEHDISLTLSASEEENHYGDPIYRVIAARRVGLIA